MKTLKTLAVLIAFAFTTSTLALSDTHTDADRAAIERILNDNYLNGFYLELDGDRVRSAFYPEMRLAVHMGDKIEYIPLEGWMAYEGIGTAPENLTEDQKAKSSAELEIVSIDMVGSSAFAMAKVFINGQLLYTNFYGLYKVGDKWQVVNKLFEQHQH